MGRGVYVPDDLQWPKHFRGMGIRIEDSVCVGDEGPVVLSVEAVKEVNHHPPSFLPTFAHLPNPYVTANREPNVVQIVDIESLAAGITTA